MKIVFIFPFINKRVGTPIKWLPLSTSSLIGNLKKNFSKIIFHQLDLEKEIKGAILRKKLDEHYLGVMEQLNKISYNIPSDKNLIKFKEFFADIVDYFKLEEYDHYFFAVYNRNKTGIKANILLAKYLKKRYENKKIVFGGIYGFGDNLSKMSFEELNFIDSFVVGSGGNATKEILTNLLSNKKLEKVYQIQTSPKDILQELPDFKSFKSFKYFQYSSKDLERAYNIELSKEKKEKKIVFIPYMFSSGCFWSKCAYCGRSGYPRFYHKDVDKIIEDLIKLKEIYQTKYFIFFNSNFNSNLDLSKKILKKIIKNKLNILWTDSFNLAVLDNELLDLLVQAGCFRMDIGTTSFDPKIQKLYNNILRNRHLKQLKRISERGIWAHINVISNLPYQYTVKKDKEILEKYIPYIDGVTLNSYRRYFFSDLEQNYEKYNLKSVNEKVFLGDRSAIMPFIENSFKGTLNERKKMFLKNYIELENFFSRNHKILNDINLYLIGYLYNELGFKNKNKIKEIVNKAKFRNIQ